MRWGRTQCETKFQRFRHLLELRRRSFLFLRKRVNREKDCDQCNARGQFHCDAFSIQRLFRAAAPDFPEFRKLAPGIQLPNSTLRADGLSPGRRHASELADEAPRTEVLSLHSSEAVFVI